MIYTLGALQPTLGVDCYLAPSAQLIGAVTLGRGSSVWFNAVLRADSERIDIGVDCNIQDATVIHCDEGTPAILGAGVSVGHRVLLHGCQIASECLIGNGAIVLDGVRIGRHCLIGAASLLVPGKEIPEGSVVMGAPARVVRPIGARELALIEQTQALYTERSRHYRRALQPKTDPV